MCLCNDSGEFKTWGDYCHAIDKIVESLFEVECFYTSRVIFNEDGY